MHFHCSFVFQVVKCQCFVDRLMCAVIIFNFLNSYIIMIISLMYTPMEECLQCCNMRTYSLRRGLLHGLDGCTCYD